MQWGIRVTDGKVFRAPGGPKSDPRVERVAISSSDWGPVVRFRIELAEPPGSLSLVYSDTDDGREQKRLIGTSEVRFEDAFSLGVVENPKADADLKQTLDEFMRPGASAN